MDTFTFIDIKGAYMPKSKPFSITVKPFPNEHLYINTCTSSFMKQYYHSISVDAILASD